MQEVLQKILRVPLGHTDGERRTDQMMPIAPEQVSRGEINFLNVADTIESDVTDRGEIEQVDVSLNRGFEFRARISKDRSGFGSRPICSVMPASAITGKLLHDAGRWLFLFHRRPN